MPHRAAGYRLDRGELNNQEWVSPGLNTNADGSLYWSILDLVAWDRAVRAKCLLKPESWALVFQPVTLNSGKSYPYGFGWFVREPPDTSYMNIAGHGRHAAKDHAHRTGGTW